MMIENPKLKQKMKILNLLHIKFSDAKLIERASFRQFKNDNLFFLDGMTIKMQKREYDAFHLYSICMLMKFRTTPDEIKEYLILQEI
jgi:hypothetical protein